MKVWLTGESSFMSRNFAKWCTAHPGKYEFENRLENVYYDYFRNFKSPMKGYSKEIDIFDPTLPVLIDRSGAEVIIHNAAIVGSDYCTASPDIALRTNIEGTLHVIESAKKIGIPLIFISTSVCYKPTDKVIQETDELDPSTIYGMTKLAGELLLKTWMRKNYVIVIPAMIFGALDLHSASNKLLMSGLRLTDETVHIALDPDYVKPFMYVDNYMDGLDCIIQNVEKLSTQRVNIAPDDPKPFGEIIEYVEEQMGLRPEYELHPDKDYLGSHVLSNDKIKSLGWKQTISLEQGLEKTREILRNANERTN